MAEETKAATELLKKAKRDRDPSLAQKASELSKEAADQHTEAECYTTLAEMRFSANSYTESTKWHSLALELYRSLSLKTQEAQCLFQLSRCAAFTSNPSKLNAEIEYLRASLAIAEEIANYELQVRCSVNLGACLRGPAPEEAREFYKKALAALEHMERGWLSGICQQSLGHLYARDSDELKARKYYLAAIEDFELARESEPINTDLRQAQCLESIGDIALKEGDEDEALDRYQSALLKFDCHRLSGAHRVREKIAALNIDQ
ncbi:MAG: hypothetical protein K2X81_06185 [Candidatus Obscuribacterales bacterium]|nr:hypothetical protein [Candidatus Obscuribacterales bacterium]